MKNVRYAFAIVGATMTFLTGCGGGGSDNVNKTGQIPTGYTVTDINGAIPASSSPSFHTNLITINNLGQVLGQYDVNTGIEYSYLYNNGSFQDISTQASFGTDNFFAHSLNNKGQILGSGPILAAVLNGSTLTNINQISGNTDFYGNQINDTGQIAGTLPAANSTRHLAVYQNNVVQDIGPIPGYNTISLAKINASGTIIGTASNYSAPNQRAILYASGHFTDIGTLPNDTDSQANSINDTGDIVGASGHAVSSIQSANQGGLTVCHAFLFKNGVMTDLGTLPGDDSSIAYGINSSGVIVGGSGGTQLILDIGINRTNAQLLNAFIDVNGKMVNLNTLIPANSGIKLYRALGINDQGQIIADGTIGSGSVLKSGTFLLTPKQ